MSQFFETEFGNRFPPTGGIPFPATLRSKELDAANLKGSAPHESKTHFINPGRFRRRSTSNFPAKGRSPRSLRGFEKGRFPEESLTIIGWQRAVNGVGLRLGLDRFPKFARARWRREAGAYPRRSWISFIPPRSLDGKLGFFFSPSPSI